MVSDVIVMISDSSVSLSWSYSSLLDSLPLTNFSIVFQKASGQDIVLNRSADGDQRLLFVLRSEFMEDVNYQVSVVPVNGLGRGEGHDAIFSESLSDRLTDEVNEEHESCLSVSVSVEIPATSPTVTTSSAISRTTGEELAALQTLVRTLMVLTHGSLYITEVILDDHTHIHKHTHKHTHTQIWYFHLQ